MSDSTPTATKPTLAPRPGTRPMATRHAFDVNTLLAWLDDHLEGFSGPLQVLQFTAGQSNPTFLLSTPQAEYVLRKQPPGDLLPSAHAIDREYRVMLALAGSGVPVPATRLYCTDATIIGTPFYLVDYQSGRIFTDPLLPDLAPEQRAAACDAMIATLAQIHSTQHDTVALAPARIDEVEAELRHRHPDSTPADRQRWRDRRLAALVAHKRAAGTDIGD